MDIRIWRNACQNLETKVSKIADDYALPRPVALFLAARNISGKGIDEFLNPKLSNLSDPYRFSGIKPAVARLWEAIRRREAILIHGDYDTDGITATALLSWVLKKNGADVYSFIPHRFDDGYGFTPDSLRKAIDTLEKDFKVLITVDCGTTSNDAVAEATRLGIDTIVTDHHEPSSELPDALALINPKLDPELKDLGMLSGAGIAFKLSHALVKYGRENNLGGFSVKLNDILDYVALGTVADIVPLLGENRILVRHGIEVLRKQLRPGTRALIETSNLRNELSPTDVTFKLAPRINAAGRVGDAGVALKLLESENIVEAYRYAEILEEYNGIRQKKEQEIFREAKLQIERNHDIANQYSILVAGKNWHQGVIGIVASRLARDYHRPAIVLTIQDGHAYGSGRSIGTLNLLEMLNESARLLERFGGHPMAVGLALAEGKIAEFAKALECSVREHLQVSELENVTLHDGIIGVEELSDHFFETLVKLSPFGHSNQKPLYRLNNLEVVKSMPIGECHTRGVLRGLNGRSIDFIAFGRRVTQFQSGQLDILATPQINEYYSVKKPQLMINDLRLSEG